MQESSTRDGTVPPRILVTGADGLIGRATVDRLLGRGIAVTALSRSWSAPIAADRIVTADVADEKRVHEALDDVTAVVHMAAIPHPDIDTPRAVFVGNTSATFTLLAAAGERGIRRAVIASSINAFGIPMNRHALSPAYYPLDELMPVAHDDAYSLSKWVDEHAARLAHSRWGMDVVALRFPLVRSLTDLQAWARTLRDNPAEQTRLAREGWAYLELTDAVDAIEQSLSAPLTGAHTLLLAAADTLLPDATEDLLDAHAPGVPRRRRFEGRRSPLDVSAAERLIGWRPRHAIDPDYAAASQETEVTA